MATQRQKILDRVAARKKQTMDKETEQLTAMQLVMMAESQQKEQLEAVQREKSHQGTEVRVKVTDQLGAIQSEKSYQGSEIKVTEHQKEQLKAVQREKSHQGSEVRVKVTRQLTATGYDRRKSTEGRVRGRTEREITPRKWGKGQDHRTTNGNWS